MPKNGGGGGGGLGLSQAGLRYRAAEVSGYVGVAVIPCVYRTWYRQSP
jgi:hypothetical protein